MLTYACPIQDGEHFITIKMKGLYFYIVNLNKTVPKLAHFTLYALVLYSAFPRVK